VLSGAVTADQLASNAAAVSFDPDELAELTEPPDRYWAARSARPWA